MKQEGWLTQKYQYLFDRDGQRLVVPSLIFLVAVLVGLTFTLITTTMIAPFFWAIMRIRRRVEY
jgi:hypothetical protein